METLHSPSTRATRFSFRQREFARLYAQGMPASQAARAAGYAASTAETNAARLLDHPRIAAYIERRRDNVRVIAGPHLAALSSRLYNLIAGAEDEKVLLSAAREVRKLLQVQLRCGAGLSDYMGEELPPRERLTREEFSELEARQLESECVNDNKAFQPTGNEAQIKNQINEILGDAPALAETDSLPSGRPAFDVRLKARTVEEAKALEPIIVNFVPLGHTDPGPDDEGNPALYPPDSPP